MKFFDPDEETSDFDEAKESLKKYKKTLVK